MKNKLSAFKFVKNNKRKVGVMIVALALTFMVMYVGVFFLLATKESFKVLFLEQPKRVAYVDLTLSTMEVDVSADSSDEERIEKADEAREHIMERMKAQEGIEDVTYTQCLNAVYSSLVGQCGYTFPLLDKEQIPVYLEHMGATLTEGRMPEGAGEILVDEVVFKNRKMELGGYFEEAAYGQIFKVVGVLDSDNLTCVGTPQGYTNNGWYMVVLCEEKNSDMTKLLNDIGIEPTDSDTIYDAIDWADMYDEIVVEQLDVSLSVTLTVVMIFLAISILVAYVSFMRSRVNEYCLYASIGYAKTDIYKMMMREIGLIFGFSIGIGAAAAVVIMLLTGHFLMENMGLMYKYFYPDYLLKILAAFLAIVALLQIPITVTINNIKTIDRIEE